MIRLSQCMGRRESFYVVWIGRRMFVNVICFAAPGPSLRDFVPARPLTETLSSLQQDKKVGNPHSPDIALSLLVEILGPEGDNAEDRNSSGLPSEWKVSFDWIRSTTSNKNVFGSGYVRVCGCRCSSPPRLGPRSRTSSPLDPSPKSLSSHKGRNNP